MKDGKLQFEQSEDEGVMRRRLIGEYCRALHVFEDEGDPTRMHQLVAMLISGEYAFTTLAELREAHVLYARAPEDMK